MMGSKILLVLIGLFSFITLLSGQDVTTDPPTEDSGGSNDEIYPQSLIAVGVLAGAIVFGLGVAKLVDVIHDRQSLRDDASDMSEYTRNLLKARITISAFKSAVDKDKDKDKERNPEESARKLFRVWSARAGRKREIANKTDAGEDSGEVAKPEAELKGYRPKGDDGVFVISPSAMEVGGASAMPTPTPREKGLMPQLTVISEQRDSEDMAEKVDEKERKNRENTMISENKKDDNEKPKSRKTSTVTTVAEKDATKPAEISTTPDTLQNSYIGYRGDSDDLMIPVSTDEPPRAKTPVSPLKTKENSNDEYEFLNNSGKNNEGDETARDNASQATNRSASQITLERMDSRSSMASEAAGVHSKPSRPGTAKGATPLSRGASQAVIPTQSPVKSRPNSAAVRPKTPAASRKTSTVSPGPNSSRPKTPGLTKSGSTVSNTKL